MTILVTGAAGFIGFHLCKRLLEEGNSVVGIDNMNSYYDPTLKSARLQEIQKISNANSLSFNFIEADLIDLPKLKSLFLILLRVVYMGPIPFLGLKRDVPEFKLAFLVKKIKEVCK